MADNYQPPILALIFRGFGWVNVIGAIIGFFILLAGNGPQEHMIGPALVALLAGLSSALLFFGASQMIDFIGQTAYNSGKIREAVTAPGQWRNMQAALDKIASQTKRPATPPAPPAQSPAGNLPPPPPPPAHPAGQPQIRRYYYLDLDNQIAGPVSEARLRRMIEENTIGEETQICQEGTEEWRPLTEAVLL